MKWAPSDFQANASSITGLVDAWVKRECTTFDGLDDDGSPSIWSDIPVVDSKMVVGLLAELEDLTGHVLDVKLIHRGGYQSADDICQRLLPRVMQACGVAPADPTTVPKATQVAT